MIDWALPATAFGQPGPRTLSLARGLQPWREVTAGRSGELLALQARDEASRGDRRRHERKRFMLRPGTEFLP